MQNSTLLIAIVLGIAAALILYWYNPESIQNDAGEPNLGWVIVLGVAVFLLIWLFFRYTNKEEVW